MDPGNGYKRDDKDNSLSPEGGYSVLLKIKDVLPMGDPINYDCSNPKSMKTHQH